MDQPPEAPREPADAAIAPAGSSTRRLLRLALWGGIGVAFLVVAALQLHRATKAPPAAPDPALRAGANPPSGAPAAVADGGTAAPSGRPNENPRFGEVRGMLSRKDYAAAYKPARQLVQDYPEDPRARIYLAVALHWAGETEAAGRELDRSLEFQKNVKSAQEYLEVLSYGGLVAYGIGRYDVAADLWEQIAAKVPKAAEKFRPMIERARAAAKGEVAPLPGTPPAAPTR